MCGFTCMRVCTCVCARARSDTALCPARLPEGEAVAGVGWGGSPAHAPPVGAPRQDFQVSDLSAH